MRVDVTNIYEHKAGCHLADCDICGTGYYVPPPTLEPIRSHSNIWLHLLEQTKGTRILAEEIARTI